MTSNDFLSDLRSITLDLILPTSAKIQAVEGGFYSRPNHISSGAVSFTLALCILDVCGIISSWGNQDGACLDAVGSTSGNRVCMPKLFALQKLGPFAEYHEYIGYA